MKNLHICVLVDDDAEPVSLGGPCPCGEGRVVKLDFVDWTLRHEDGREHPLPRRVVDTHTTVHYRERS